MKITREEFKSVVALQRQLWDLHDEYTPYINEELLADLLYPAMNFMKDKLGLVQADGDIDVIDDLLIFGRVPVNIVYYQMPDGEINYTCEYTDDLDKIYDWYLNKSENN